MSLNWFINFKASILKKSIYSNGYNVYDTVVLGAQLQIKIEHLDQALLEHADELAAGEFVVVAAGQIRAR
jgi:hypothetical protein